MGNPKAILFMGNGDRSMANAYKLHRILEIAINNLGGIQQGCVSENEMRRAEFEIDGAAKDIYLALTGEAPWLTQKKRKAKCKTKTKTR